MEKKINEVATDNFNWGISPKSITITQLLGTNKKEAIKVFNQLKKSIPANYRADMVKYNYSHGSSTGDHYSDCPYFMIVSQHRFLGYSFVTGYSPNSIRRRKI